MAERQGSLHMGERALQFGPDGGAELGQLRPRLAMDERPTELALERADRGRQGRLRHAAASRRTREMQLLAQGEEVNDLSDFHVPRDPSISHLIGRHAAGRPPCPPAAQALISIAKSLAQ